MMLHSNGYTGIQYLVWAIIYLCNFQAKEAEKKTKISSDDVGSILTCIQFLSWLHGFDENGWEFKPRK